MMGRNHISTGVISGCLVAFAADLPTGHAVGFVGVTAACSLLPDFDHPDAMLPRMLGWPGRALAAIISSVFGHRTLTHSVLGLGLLAVSLTAATRLPGYLVLAALLGCVTHILGDMLTISGVPVFWPAPIRLRIGWMRTNGAFEQLMMTPLLALGAVASAVLVVVANA